MSGFGTPVTAAVALLVVVVSQWVVYQHIRRVDAVGLLPRIEIGGRSGGED